MSRNSTTIAIAGGTGTIGSSIIAALLAADQYIPFILSRATPHHPAESVSRSLPTLPTLPTYPTPSKEIETRYVDYASLDSLVTALQGVNTLISTLLIPGPDSVTYHLNLLTAAINAGVKRFAPSEFALSQKAHSDVEIDHGKITIWNAVKSAVREGKIDAAAFPVGMFMNYLAIGISDKQKENEARAGFREGPLMFHLEDEPAWVEVPVPVSTTGEWPDITMTDIRDVGRFVVGALGMQESWGGRELGIAGDTRNLRDVVEILRRGIRKEVLVKEVSVDELRRRREGLAEGDILAKMDVDYMTVCAKGGSVVPGVLNELCPGVEATTIEAFVHRYWAM
ncbi:hypothetical protein BJX70DRAFT_396104 [Aspergillus crustosus]